MLSTAESSNRLPAAASRIRYARIPEVLPIPNLIELQLDSFKWFVDKGLRELFDEISPIKDFTGKVMELQFLDYEFGPPKYTELECRTKDLTFSRPLYVNVELLIKETGEIQRQRVYMGDFPTMTDQGTFVINGAERVVVSQLVRSPGRLLQRARGSHQRPRPVLGQGDPEPRRLAGVRDEQQGPALGQGGPQAQDRGHHAAARRRLRERRGDPRRCYGAIDTDPEHPYVANTLDKDVTHTQQEALIEVYKKLRPGDPPTGDNARQLVESLFFNFRRYDLGRVGRYKFNKKLAGVAERMGIELPVDQRHDHPRGHRRDRRPPDRVQPRPPSQGRHRPPRQPPHPRQRRADPERVPDRPPADGARRPRAHDDPGDRQGHPERPHQHPARRGGDEGVLRRQPALPVHGPDEPAGRADVASAASVALGPGRPVAASAPGSTSATSTTATTAASARSRRRKARTSASSARSRPTAASTRYGFIETPYRKVKRTVAWDDPNLLDLRGRARTSPRATATSSSRPATGSPTRARRCSSARRPSPSRSGRSSPDEIEYLPADEEEEYHVAQANAPLDDAGPLRQRPRPVPLPRHVPRGSAQPGRVHGRLAQAGRLRRHGAHPVPRARRRQPRPHGLEHAAPGRAAPRAGGADRRHRHGGARRARLRPGHRGAAGRASSRA